MEHGGTPFSRHRFLPIIDSYRKEGPFVVFRCKGLLFEVAVFRANILRFRYTPEVRFRSDFSYALIREPDEDTSYELREVGEDYHLITSELKVVISRTMHLSIYDVEGNLISEDDKGYTWEPHPSMGGNIVSCYKRIGEREIFLGLGDKPGKLNLRGRHVQNWASDSYGFERNTDPLYKSIPFFLGLRQGRGYGIFFDNSFRSHFDFGYHRPDVLRFWAKGGEMRYYFIHGPELTRVSESYSWLTGTPDLPPLWALGFHQSKWSYTPEAKVREIAGEFRKRKIPCDVLHLDIDYMDDFRCFTWDAERFSDPAAMISDLEAEGFKSVAIIDPGIKVDRSYGVYVEAEEKRYFCRRADGDVMKGDAWPGACNFPDFTDPEVREWWAGLFEDFMACGLKGIWNDMNEPSLTEQKTFPPDTRHRYDGHACSHRKAHNVYGMQMARASWHGAKRAVFPHRPFLLSRAGYAGVQRYAAVWTGDNLSTWDHLWMANVQCQRLSISGISFCGSDIGGFYDNSNGELLVRWLQLAVFHPLFRTHSTNDHVDQEPWAFGEPYTSIARKTIELRYKLLPYIYSVFYRQVSRGTPMLLPLVYLDQHNPDALERMEEFALGRDILVCPVVNAGDRSRLLYLPQGDWYDYHSDECYPGRQEIKAEAPLDRIPMFIRAGAVIPHNPVQQYVGERKFRTLSLHIYFLEGEYASELYEDPGDFFEQEQGNLSIKTFRVRGSGSTLEIEQQKEGRFNPSYRKYELVIHGLPFIPAGLRQDGELTILEAGTLAAEAGSPLRIVVDKAFDKVELLRLDQFA